MRVLGRISGVVWLVLATAATAQTVDVPKTFQLFDRFCRPALIGLDAFKEVASVPGPFGEKVFSVSPDGHFITAQTGVDDFIVLAEYRYGPGFVSRNCMVQQIVAAAVDYPTVDAALQSELWSGEGVTVTGGEVVEEIPAIGAMRMAGTGNITRPRSGYMIYGATEPSGSIVHALTAQGMFTLTGNVLVPR